MIVIVVLLIMGLFIVSVYAIGNSRALKEANEIIEEKKKEYQELDEMYADLSDAHLELSMKLSSDCGASGAITEELAHLNKLLDEKKKELMAMEQTCIAATEKRQELQDQNERLLESNGELAVKGLEGQDKFEKILEEIETLNRKKEELMRDLEDLEETKRIALSFVDEEEGERRWEFALSGKEEKLIELIGELCELYPELTTEFRGIEWRKVWMPKAQDLCKREGLDKCCGIYRLIKKDDEKVCYVGQAVDIKERWYQHIKKMIGVDARGGEKLYDGNRPNDFWWTVIERVGKDRLDEQEHYWISFFRADEIGLNKKK